MKDKEKFNIALHKYVDSIKGNKNIVGIFVTGSFIHSQLDKNSDLDVYVLTKDSKFRERGNTWIDGIEIEYFFNPIKQVEKYFEEEVKKGGPHTCHMFVNSKILFQRGNELNRLIKKAKNILKKPRAKMKNITKEFYKYQIDDLEKDLEDTYLKKDKFAFNLVANNVIDKSLDIFLEISRTYKEKHKRLLGYLQKKDKKFANLFEAALLENNMAKKYQNLIKLIRYVESRIDGKRPKEWKLRSKCTY